MGGWAIPGAEGASHTLWVRVDCVLERGWEGGGGGGRPHPRKRLGLGLRVAAADTIRDVAEGWWLLVGWREGRRWRRRQGWVFGDGAGRLEVEAGRRHGLRWGDGEEADATVRVGGARGYVDLRVGRGRSVDGG